MPDIKANFKKCMDRIFAYGRRLFRTIRTQGASRSPTLEMKEARRLGRLLRSLPQVCESGIRLWSDLNKTLAWFHQNDRPTSRMSAARADRGARLGKRMPLETIVGLFLLMLVGAVALAIALKSF